MIEYLDINFEIYLLNLFLIVRFSYFENKNTSLYRFDLSRYAAYYFDQPT